MLADDSGLEVAALDGRPGVLSARFAGEGASDEENVAQTSPGAVRAVGPRGAFRLLALSASSESEKRPRRLRPSRSRRTASVEGTITLAPRGTDGFGYDPVFQPDGWDGDTCRGLTGGQGPRLAPGRGGAGAPGPSDRARVGDRWILTHSQTWSRRLSNRCPRSSSTGWRTSRSTSRSGRLARSWSRSGCLPGTKHVAVGPLPRGTR